MNMMMAVVVQIESGEVDLEYSDNEGFTALLWAAEQGKLEVAKLLLEAGAKVNVQSERGVLTGSN